MSGIMIRDQILEQQIILVLLSLKKLQGWRRKWQPTPVFLPREFHGQRSLAGYSPWGHKESEETERLHFHFHSSQVGFPGGASGKEPACQCRRCKRHRFNHGSPLQYSCLENLMDRGAWRATVHGVAKSRT